MPVVPDLSSLLASPGELATLLQRTLTTEETAAAALVLSIASDAVRTFTRQTLSLVADDSYVLDVDDLYELWLPERPVTAVASITIDGTLQVDSSYSWTNTGRIRFPLGLGYLGDSDYYYRGRCYRQATIVYSHGFDPMRGDIKGVVLDLAMGAVIQPPESAGVTEEQIGNYSVKFDHQRASALTADHERQLKAYRPQITNIPIVVR